MTEIHSAVLLASGGLDSTTMAYWLLKKKISFIPLFINYGQHCAETELETLQTVLPNDLRDKIEQIDVSSIYKGSSSRMINEANLWKDKIEAADLHIPYRNLLILSIAAAFSQSRGINEVYTAFINSNHAKEVDCSANFFNSLEGLMEEFGGISINMPFRYKSKLEVAQLGQELMVPIGTTYSCQASSKTPCGACPNCVDRLNALKDLEFN
ncbi:MAG: 7-cyano-7-deazaguanine synthase [Desulfotalea sp.]